MTKRAPVLLAEDDENDIFLMRRAFARAEVSNPLIALRNGQEVIELLRREGRTDASKPGQPPCLLLLDLNMPMMDGFDVLTWLKRHKRHKALTVVVLTSSAREPDLARAFDLGADAYLVKPSDFNQLVIMVRDLRERILESPSATPWAPSRTREGRC